MANNAAKIHTPKIVATVASHVGCEETRTCKGFAVNLYNRMLSTFTKFIVRPADIRLLNGRNVNTISPQSHVTLSSEELEKIAFK